MDEPSTEAYTCTHKYEDSRNIDMKQKCKVLGTKTPCEANGCVFNEPVLIKHENRGYYSIEAFAINYIPNTPSVEACSRLCKKTADCETFSVAVGMDISHKGQCVLMKAGSILKLSDGLETYTYAPPAGFCAAFNSFKADHSVANDCLQAKDEPACEALSATCTWMK